MTPLTARQIMEKLVSFPTVSRDSNLELISWVEEYLKGYGIAATRVYDTTGKKAALYANVGPEVDGGIVLSGHTDVVPVDGQAWDTDPWVVTQKGGRLYGRGTCDMKGFDALALAAVPLALERGVKRPLQIALSYDEEVGCLGAPPMIDEMVKHLPRAAGAIIGEPSMMKTVTAHKGSVGYHTHLRGFEVHSSLIHTGVNAIMFGAKLIEWANEINAQNAAAKPSALADVFVPPYTTAHVGRIEGGTAHNITAKDCMFGMDFRVVPGESMQAWRDRYLEKVRQVEVEMQAIHPDTRIDVEPYFSVPPLSPEKAGAAEALARSITGDNGTHVVSYGTEAGQFQERGYSAVVCGPGDIAQAHQPNEYIEVSQFEAGEAFLAKVVDSLCREDV
ncbi:acetylornithine deacetylase [Oceaniglobus ichthyenteri]|uniref:acetylornithine deacetylase n=1 Tax=Oceaniglobus ichthyenteri TaxID=2136177 RepID=UPI000D3B784E|nr:acetylornithine deacetylase [Oceaniglobus ichthyenteri]